MIVEKVCASLYSANVSPGTADQASYVLGIDLDGGLSFGAVGPLGGLFLDADDARSAVVSAASSAPAEIKFWP